MGENTSNPYLIDKLHKDPAIALITDRIAHFIDIYIQLDIYLPMISIIPLTTVR